MGKGLLSFLIKLLVLSVVAYTALIYSESLSFLNKDADDVEIKIKYGDIITDTLALDHYGTVGAYRRKKVTWSIGAGATTVQSFSIMMKPSSYEVFTDTARPPSRLTRKGYGRIRAGARNNKEYDYSIYWKDNNGIPHIFDPKIAIKPSANFVERIIYIGYGLAALILTLSFFNLRNKK